MVLLTFMLSDMPLPSTDEQIKAANNGIRDLIMHYKKLLERESSQDVAEKQATHKIDTQCLLDKLCAPQSALPLFLTRSA